VSRHVLQSRFLEPDLNDTCTLVRMRHGIDLERGRTRTFWMSEDVSDGCFAKSSESAITNTEKVNPDTDNDVSP